MNIFHLIRRRLHDPNDTVTAPATTTTTVAPPDTTTTTTVAPPAPFYDAFPATWRDDTVATLKLDESDKNILNKYQSYPDLIKGTINAQKALSKRQENAIPTLPDNPTVEQITEYRSKLGLPTKVEDYKIAPPTDAHWDEATDGAVMATVAKVAFENNIKPQHAQTIVNTLIAEREKQIDAIETQHGVDKQEATKFLKQHWSSDYQTNVNIVAGLVNGLPESIRADFADATLANGKKLFNSPEVLVWMADIARALNPGGTVLPAGSSNDIGTIESEITKIKALFNTDKAAYYAAEPRLLKLYEARDAMKSKAA